MRCFWDVEEDVFFLEGMCRREGDLRDVRSSYMICRVMSVVCSVMAYF